MRIYRYYDLFSRLFNAKMYLIIMTIYHILAIVYYFYEVKGYKLKTLVPIDDALIHNSYGLLDVFYSGKKISTILILSTILIFIDLIFLMILSYDFRGLNLTISRITILEVIIFILALLYPEFRGVMLFFSLNTLQIFVFYHMGHGIYNIFNTNIFSGAICIGAFYLLLEILSYPLFL